MANLNSPRPTTDYRKNHMSDSTGHRECGSTSHGAFANDTKRTTFRTGSFRQYLDNYENKKFTSVKLTVPAKQETLKTELIINVTDPSDKPTSINLQPTIINRNEIRGNSNLPKNNTIQVQSIKSSKFCIELNEKIAAPFHETPILVTDTPPLPPPLPVFTSLKSSEKHPKWPVVQTNSKLRNPYFDKNSNEKGVPIAVPLPSSTKIDVSRQPKDQNKKEETNKMENSKNGHYLVPSSRVSSNFERNSRNGKDVLDSKPNTTTIVPVSDGDNVTNITKTDPRVKKLVYNTYRNFLSAYNNKANEMISTLPRNMVQVDQGVSKQIESITQAVTSHPPPPPPIGATASIPATKLKTEISDRRTEPPLCVQNAMLTKDKKPFTYTPGGLDLSEIRSPRMARRLERNAMSEGVSPLAQQQQSYQGSRPLPPSALAAMQPQLSVQVFPTGKIPQLNHNNHAGPPPPPPPPNNIPRPPAMNLNAPLPVDSFDRPDMTKIIPDNPMALLRKTQGPVVKQDPIFNRQNYRDNKSDNVVVNSVPQHSVRKSEPSSPDTIDNNKIRNAGVGSIYVPPLNQNDPQPTSQFSHPSSQFSHPSSQISKQQQQENGSRDIRQSPHYSEGQQQPGIRTDPLPREISRQRSINSPQSPQELLSKNPSPWMTQKRAQQDVPEWATNEKAFTSPSEDTVMQSRQQQVPQPQISFNQQPQLESNNWRGNNESRQQRQVPQPQTNLNQQPQLESNNWRDNNESRQQRQVPQPQTNLNQQPQLESNNWRDNNESRQQRQVPQPQTNLNQQPQLESNNWRQNRPTQYSQPEATSRTPIQGVQRQISHHDQYNPPARSTGNVEVVIVNDPPPVFYHPGQPQYNTKSQNVHTRQDNSTNVRIVPIQIEASFENGNVARNNGNDSNMRGFNRQQSWNSQPTQSNTFKVLQKITQTDGDDDENLPIREHSPKSTNKFPQRQISREQYPRDEHSSNFSAQFNSGPRNEQVKRGPQVRTIPIQLEDDSSNRFYVPPSEQIVREPKIYTGGSIPSRSFKMLQAMTSPEELASANDENYEIYSDNPRSNSEWEFNSDYSLPPYYYNPYWDPHSRNYFGINDEHVQGNVHSRKGLSGNERHEDVKTESDATANQTKHRLTPVPGAQCYYPNQNKRRNCNNRKTWNLQPMYAQFPPFWDPNAYGYYYGTLPPGYPVYPPHHFYPPSVGDNEDYSSTDEMSYYGTRFASMPCFDNAPRPNSVIDNKSHHASKTKENNSETSKKCKKPLEEDSSMAETSDSDSEMTGYEVCKNPVGLQAIRSVSNIEVYEEDETSCCSDEEYDNSDENDTLSVRSGEEAIPHQLSVIYEETEQIDNDIRFLRETSVATTVSEDTETVENSDSEEEKKEGGTVFVKLPLRLNFAADDFQKVTTITVGDSEVSDQNYKNSVKRSSRESEVTHSDDNSEVDWWGQIQEVDSGENDKEDTAVDLDDGHDGSYQIANKDDLTVFGSEINDLDVGEESENYVGTNQNSKEECHTWEEGEIDFWAEIINDDAEGIERNKSGATEPDRSNNDSLSSRSSSSSSSQNSSEMVHDDQQNATKENIYHSSNNLENDPQLAQNFQEIEIKIKVADRISAIEDLSFPQRNVSKLSSRKSSVKSQDDFSEEDYDSGVTSDVSKHISEVDNESDSIETKELYRYQRAATHSRLFKLLQDECDNEGDVDDDDANKKVISTRKETLNLPLNKNNTSETESFSSSGFNSPASPTINKKFLSDLMQSLLQTDPSLFKNMTLEKLQAAAIRILQEDAEENLCPVESSKNCCSESSTPAQTPQEFYSNFNDYNQYYDSWAEASRACESQGEILPSKAFRLIQAHAAHNKTGAITGLSARCPRVSSYKNVQKELTRLIELQKNQIPNSTELVDFDEATNAP